MATATAQRVPDEAVAVATAARSLRRCEDGTYRFGIDLAQLGVDTALHDRLTAALAAVNELAASPVLGRVDLDATSPVMPVGGIEPLRPGEVPFVEGIYSWRVSPKSNAVGLAGALYSLGVFATLAGIALVVAAWGCTPAAVGGFALAILGLGCIAVAGLITWEAGDDGVLIVVDTDRVTLHVYSLP